MSFKRYIVAIDQDEVLNNLIDATLLKTGIPVSKESITEYSIDDALTKDQVECVRRCWEDADFWDELSVTPKSQKAVNDIIELGCEVFVVTSCELEMASHKAAWINRHFPAIPKDNFVVCKKKRIVDCDFIIDDRIETLVTMPQWVYRVCMDRPWNNRGKEYDEVHAIQRVKDLDEARVFIKKIMEMEEG